MIPPAAQPTLWHAIAHASLMVKLVMMLLLGLSITSWAFILQRIYFLRKIKQQDHDFQTYFSSGIDPDALYETIDQNPSTQTTLARIYHTGRNAFNLPQSDTSISHRLQNANRAMGITQRKAITQLETHLSFLATVGSTSPYIGLFGTVWGIMNAFSALGSVQTASIAMVAPGISEALITTALGLFVAIPAVIAYNRFTHQVEQLADTYHNFQENCANQLIAQS